MNFDFTEDQYLLRDSVQSYLSAHWGSARLRAANAAFSPELWQGLCTLGLQTLLVPEEFGGAGLGMVDAVLSFEAFGHALVPGPMMHTILISDIVARFGTKEQRGTLLPRIASGEMRLAFAHAEAGAGYGVDELAVRAEEDAGGWRLNGRKILVPAAQAATALVVSARLPDGRAGLFLCVLPQLGVTMARNSAIDPDSMTSRAAFNGAAAEMLGTDADASVSALDRLLQTCAAAAAAEMAGIAGAALDMAVAYAKQRTQFDRPIGAFQAIKHKCADMLIAAEYAKSAAYYAAWTLTEATGEASLAVSVAKAACGDASRLVCNECLQIHGGVGFTSALDVHLYLKRGKLLEYSFGDAAWHRERVAHFVLPTATSGANALTAP
jgi:acyl-CoA dehydrogenase